MKITQELSLTRFEFWSGAKDHNFTYNELKELETALEDMYFDSNPSETDINDLFWFEDEMLCELIGVDHNEYLNR